LKLPVIGPTKHNVILITQREIEVYRNVVAVSLGCHWDGVSFPHPDNYDTETLVDGVNKRFLCKPPAANEALRGEFNRFVKKWVVKYLTPLDPSADDSLETWLGGTSYTESRKSELRNCWDQVVSIWEKTIPKGKYFICKSFGKDESYPTFKHARAINSRSDAFKCAVGPMFHLIEQQVFALKWFIKKIPIINRPAYIYENLYRDGATYFASDYTAYESMFTAQLMRDCEFELYDYMTSRHNHHDQFMELCERVLAGKNTCKFKNFRVEVDATRMSGEMNTSLGNGFSNLMFMLFLCKRAGSKDVSGVVEGDDGLFVCNGPLPTAEDFKLLGLTIKIELHENLSTASFCGLVFDELDLLNVSDPIKILAKFGWASNRYAKSNNVKLQTLLRCKSLSLLAQYPGCPIVQELALYGLRTTGSVEKFVVAELAKNSVGYWEREMRTLISEKPQPRIVPIRTRLLCEKLYNITIAQQLEVEKYLSKLTTLQPLKLDCLMHLVPPDAVTFDSEYSTYTYPHSAYLTRPVDKWVRLASKCNSLKILPTRRP